MKRRTMLAIAAAGGTSALAGCVGGYEITSSDEIAALEEQISDLEDEITEHESTIDDLEDTIDVREAEIDQLESEIDQTEQEISDLENQLATAESERDDLEEELEALENQHQSLIQEELLALYESGYEFATVADGAYQNGLSAKEIDEDRHSLRWLSIALSWADAASAFFARAGDVAYEHGFEDAVPVADDASIHYDYLFEACDYYALAMVAYLEGDTSEYESRWSDGDEALEAATDYEVASIEEFENLVYE